jgi:hypothetical protein
VSVRLVVLLGGKGVRVSTSFINAFQKKKAWNLPNPPQISAISKPVFFLLKMWRFQNSFFSPPENVAISKLFFFPS